MNTNYSVLWVDDSEEFYEATEELVEDCIVGNSMIPKLQYYGSYAEFHSGELASFEVDVFNRHDLLLIDYALSGTTGIEIIQELRRKEIYTDVVFYSSHPEDMKKELQEKGQLDGVFLADRQDLTTVLNNVIKKNLRREYNIANIRGLIMDSSSDFDYICRITVESLFEKLNPETQEKLEEKLREYVMNAQSGSSKTFEDLLAKKGTVFVNKVMNSVEYVMKNQDRYAILNMILREFSFSNTIPADLDTQYGTDVIGVRNKLAHNKLYYGECKKKIHIAKKRQALRCNEDCENCSTPYSVEYCEKLRKKLFEYYQLFESIDKNTIACIE